MCLKLPVEIWPVHLRSFLKCLVEDLWTQRWRPSHSQLCFWPFLMSRYGGVLLKIRCSPFFSTIWLWVCVFCSPAVLLLCPPAWTTQRLFDTGNWLRTLARGSQELRGTKLFLCASVRERMWDLCELKQRSHLQITEPTVGYLVEFLLQSTSNTQAFSSRRPEPRSRPFKHWSMRISAQSDGSSAQAPWFCSTLADGEAVMCSCSSTDVPAYNKLYYARADPQRRLIHCLVSLRLRRSVM